MINQQLSILIKKYAGNTQYNNEDDLEWDLGITGDDAYDFLVEYRHIFNVNISNFNFEEYFHDEGSNMMLLVKRILRKKSKKRLTPHDLLKGIKSNSL